jgi:hypothetical protein
MSSNSKKSVPRRINFDDPSKQESTKKDVSAIPVRTSPRKRTLESFVSPAKTPGKEIAYITPLKRTRVDEVVEKVEEEYVPIHVYKNIEYKRMGEAVLDKVTKTTFALVQEHFILPKDLETNRKYGPKSGICFEEHAIRAYSQNMLESKTGASVEICIACATTGHQRNECPSLI